MHQKLVKAKKAQLVDLRVEFNVTVEDFEKLDQVVKDQLACLKKKNLDQVKVSKQGYQTDYWLVRTCYETLTSGPPPNPLKIRLHRVTMGERSENVAL